MFILSRKEILTLIASISITVTCGLRRENVPVGELSECVKHITRQAREINASLSDAQF